MAPRVKRNEFLFGHNPMPAIAIGTIAKFHDDVMAFHTVGGHDERNVHRVGEPGVPLFSKIACEAAARSKINARPAAKAVVGVDFFAQVTQDCNAIFRL
jgi:hypothetical protein